MGKLITFWSPANTTGVTTLAILVGHQLSRHNSVCLIDLDLNNSDVGAYLGFSDSEHNIDNLKPYIVGKSLNPDVLMVNTVRYQKLYILQGTKNTEKAAYFKPEDILPVIDLAVQTFDIVILNTMPTFDNIATFYALKKADETVIVLNQNMFQYRKLTSKLNTLAKLTQNRRSFIVMNKYSKNLNLFAENIYQNINIPVLELSELKYNDITKSINLMEKTIIEIFKNHRTQKFQAELQGISDKLLIDLGFKSANADEETKKKGFFK